VAAGNDGDVFTYSGRSWSDGNLIDTQADPALSGVSCSSSSFCMAVDGNGDAYTYS
jgi:hypothetical protein